VAPPSRRVDEAKQVLARQNVTELGAEQYRQGLHRDEEVSARRQPATVVLVDPASRHDVVHVPVVVQRPAPSVQDAKEAEANGADELGVRSQGAQRLAGSVEQRGVHHALMASGQRAPFRGQSEGDQKVGTR